MNFKNKSTVIAKSTPVALATALTALLMNGCIWDSGLYDTYARDGKLEICNEDGTNKDTCNVDRCDELVEISMNNVVRCTKDDCIGCDDEQKKQCNEYKENKVFEYNICPGAYPKCFDGKCIKDCPPNQHKDNSTGKCEEDSNANCGSSGNDCSKVIDGWKDGTCEHNEKGEAYCKISECKPNYKLEDNQCRTMCEKGKHLSGSNCVSNDDENCGQDGYVCKIQMAGWKDGSCDKQEGICKATDCETGYELKDGKCEALMECPEGKHFYSGTCEVDSLENCGNHGTDCNKIAGWTDGNCVSGKCIATNCDTGYELNDNGTCKALIECPDHQHINSGACEEDSVENCGKHGNDCSFSAGWGGGDCIDGECKATACIEGYSIDIDKCVASCVGTQVYCGDKCRDPMIDNEYCGATGTLRTCDNIPGEKACAEGMVCVDGSCETNTCNEGMILCSINGIKDCKNIKGDDAEHCGACNYKCSEHAIPNATSETCSGGDCQYICAPGFVNVSAGTTANTIKCIDPHTDNTYCGAKNADEHGIQCTSGTVCVEGECKQNSCAGKTETPNLCVVNGINDCKNIKSSDADHCGACNYKCSEHAIPNATSNTCSGGNCLYACAEGFVNVSAGTTADIIKCIDPRTDNTYCGAKSASELGNSCTGGTVCVEGGCVQTECTNSSETLCQVGTSKTNTCINVKGNKADHCGACNYKCSEHAIPNATSDSCSGGNCQYTCSGNFVNVSEGATANTIKCIDPKTDNAYCGAKSASNTGRQCTGGTVCVDGACVQTTCTNSNETLCQVGNSKTNTCINVRSNNADHCGACNYKCSEHSIQNATSESCLNGNCLYTCSGTFVNVSEGTTANTIKCIDPKSDSNYCGAKSSSNVGIACTGGRQCKDGICRCSGSQVFCDGVCIDPMTSNRFCGASGNCSGNTAGEQCKDGKVCINGGCVQNSCSDPTPDLCVVGGKNVCKKVNGGDADHCGSCNYKCSDHIPTNAKIKGSGSGTCSSGKCQYDCVTEGKIVYVNVGSDATYDNIKCIDPQTNSSFCGATGNSADQKGTNCSLDNYSTGVCAASKCVCKGGYRWDSNNKQCVVDSNSCVNDSDCHIDNAKTQTCNSSNKCTVQVCKPGFEPKTNPASCDVCGKGYYSTGVECILCAADYYTDTEGQSSCKKCPTGASDTNSHKACACKNKNAKINDNNSACVCKSNYYGDGITCTACPSGSASDEGSSVCTCNDAHAQLKDDNSACICKSNYYGDGTTCTACPSGTTSDAGSTSIGDCKCNNEHAQLNDDKSACICKKNYYGDGTTCTACPDGSVSNAGSASCACDSANDYYNCGSNGELKCLKLGTGVEQTGCDTNCADCNAGQICNLENGGYSCSNE